MKAYHGSQYLKDKVIEELKAHYDADNFVKGTYWENGKGCAVGCLLKSSNHIEYEGEFGIPVHLARLEDLFFEKLPNDLSKEWPIRFMSSFDVGKDYSQVVWDFLRWLLLDHLHLKITQEGDIFDDVRKSLRQSAKVLGQNNAAADADAVAAADAAAAAAAAAASADAAAAASADAAADAVAAAYAAASAAAAAYAAVAAAVAAADVYILFSDRLIELIKSV